MEPVISVIVPIYNVEKYLPKCIESIIAQTYSNLEIILVEDGSPDRCAEICDKYAAKDSRIKVIHKENGGLSSARNSGLDIATGDYISFVDSDDYLAPAACEVMLKKLSEAQADVCIGHYCKVDTKGEITSVHQNVTKEEIYNTEEALSKLAVGWSAAVIAWGKLFKREIFYSLRFKSGKVHEDEFIVHRILDSCAKVVQIPDVLYYYLQREDSITGVSFSVKRFDGVEALLDRSIYYFGLGRADDAVNILYSAAVLWELRSEEIDVMDSVIKSRQENLLDMIKTEYKKRPKRCGELKNRTLLKVFVANHRIHALLRKVVHIFKKG